MNNFTCLSVHGEPELHKAFIQLPQRLYKKDFSSQNTGDEKALLSGVHPLSRRFTFLPFLVKAKEKVIGRAALAIYKEQPDKAYLGFFEMENEPKAAAFFFEKLESEALKRGCRCVAGPMNASFWLGYRMRISGFDKPPFFSEPYNPAYYQSLWEANGYGITDRYISNIYPAVKPGGYTNARYQKRLDHFRKLGYEIAPPKAEEWDRVIREIYGLIIDLYSGFPGFSYISEAEFIGCFNSLRYVVDFNFCTLVRFQGKAVAFNVTIPDYGNMLNGSLSPLVLLRMLYRKKHCKNYIVLYMGADPKHKGLGTAMSQVLLDKLREKNASAVGAFIHAGKVTGAYGRQFIQEQHTYALFEKQLHKSREEKG